MTTDVFLFEPHCDDWLISKGIAAAHYLGAGIRVHVVSMSAGGSGGVLDDLAGQGTNGADVICGWHGYRHDPVREGYIPPVEADFHDLRMAETRNALGVLAASINGSGQIVHHDGGLPTGFGGTGSTPTRAGIDAAKGVIRSYVDTFGNGLTFFHTMSWTDDHPDHAACGQALRELKQDPAYASLLGGSRFFVSRLYWNDPDVLAEGPVAFPVNQTRKAEYAQAVRWAAKAYAAWQPPHSFGIGYHQVINQFYSNGLDAQGNGTPSNAVAVECRWHD